MEIQLLRPQTQSTVGQSSDGGVTIFANTAVALAMGMEGNTADRSEVALDSSKLFFKSHMEECSLKLVDFGRGCGYIHGFLTIPQHHVVKVGRKGMLCFQ